MNRIQTLKEASEDELKNYNDVCAICYSDMQTRYDFKLSIVIIFGHKCILKEKNSIVFNFLQNSSCEQKNLLIIYTASKKILATCLCIG